MRREKVKMKNVAYQPLRNEDEIGKDGSKTEDLLPSWDYIDIMIIILKIILWCSLMAFFITIEFGAVFFVVSVFYFMFTNFRKSKKEPGELSAYSVFNPNCETIKGTLTAQQFENEIKFGIGSLH